MPRSNPTQTLHPQTSHSPRPLPSFVSATPLLSVSVTCSLSHLPYICRSDPPSSAMCSPCESSSRLRRRSSKAPRTSRSPSRTRRRGPSSLDWMRMATRGSMPRNILRTRAVHLQALLPCRRCLDSPTPMGTAIYLLRSWSNAARTRSLEAPRPSIMPRIGSTTSRQRSSRNSSSVRWAQSSSCENDAIRSVEVMAAVHK